MSVNYDDLFKNDPSFRDSIDQINSAWNSLQRVQTGCTDPVFLHPALQTIEWRIYETCYGNFYDDDESDKPRKKPVRNEYRSQRSFEPSFESTIQPSIEESPVDISDESPVERPITPEPSKPVYERHIPPVVPGIKTLVARNLPRNITPDMIRSVFQSYGTINDIYIPKNMDKSSPYYGTTKGFALIKFASSDDSANAFSQQYGRVFIGGNKILLDFANHDR
jgi:hypothetical protein